MPPAVVAAVGRVRSGTEPRPGPRGHRSVRHFARSEVTAVAPEVVPGRGDTGAGTPGPDVDFRLHRRVIEINDGVPALRGYRSGQVQEAAAEAVAGGAKATLRKGTEVEAAVLTAAVAAKRAADAPGTGGTPPAAGAHSRKGDVRAGTEWLLLVTRASLRHRPRETATPGLTGTADGSGS
ncbi:DUF6545 domain-containing protein [Streptomyces sp. NPDC058701]|uniref:DUF6545 domain-containing protein n=1 Tax=Streptomyces sp. NPDC058701 TaxID=3346608 RepID=UPI0036682AC5